MNNLDLFCNFEEIRDRDYVIATYYCHECTEGEVVRKATTFASGQTLGTWINVPNITAEMNRKHLAKIVDIIRIPPSDIASSSDCRDAYIISLAFPIINFGLNIPMMLTTLLGNDASTSSQLKLIDITLPDAILSTLHGPGFGIDGLRALTNASDRPLVLNMIKPCIGLSPQEGAAVFYETALGGVDIIKDDELLGNTAFSPLTERVAAYRGAADRAYEKTGKRTLYAANVTDRADHIIDNAKTAEEQGADIVMVNYAVTGYGMIEAVAEAVSIPVLGHYAGSSFWSESAVSGIACSLANGKLPRLCGADIAIINTPYGNYPLCHSSYMNTAKALNIPLGTIRRAWPGVGGGVHPAMVEQFVADLGCDIVLAVGGAVQGHPSGASAGARAMVAAAEAAANGISADEMAQNIPELKEALKLWKKR